METIDETISNQHLLKPWHRGECLRRSRFDSSPEEIQIYMDTYLKNIRDIFAWSYEEIPGINPKIVEHEITTVSWMPSLV